MIWCVIVFDFIKESAHHSCLEKMSVSERENPMERSIYSGLDKDMLDKIKFSFSSRNAESLVSTCRAHVFVTSLKLTPAELATTDWKYVISGIVALLRNRVAGKKGPEWQISLCIVDANYGISVWKGTLGFACAYSVIGDRFHIFELHTVEGIMGILFESEIVAAEFQATYTKWHRERQALDKKDKDLIPAGPRFTRDMISKPCNFQHIAGSQALEQILDMEKLKSDVHLKIVSVGPGKDQIDGFEKRSRKLTKAASLTDARFEGFPIPIPTVPRHRVMGGVNESTDTNSVGSHETNGHLQGAVGGVDHLQQRPVVVSNDETDTHLESDSAITSLSGNEYEDHEWMEDVLSAASIPVEPVWDSKDFNRSFIYSTLPKKKKQITEI